MTLYNLDLLYSRVITGEGRNKTIHHAVNPLIHPVSLFMFLFLAYFLVSGTIQLMNLALILLLAIPFGYIVYASLDKNTPLARFFASRIWIFLGTISYSLYICSTPVIDGMRLLYKPTDALTNILFILVTLAVCVTVSYVMYQIIEYPYFMLKPKRREIIHKNVEGKRGVMILIIFFITSLFIAYSSRFNFLSREMEHTKDMVHANVHLDTSVRLSQQPISLTFTSAMNDLGVILLPIHNIVPITEVDKKKMLRVRLKQTSSDTWYAQQSTNLSSLGGSTSYLFGFPPIKTSKGKDYVMELNTQNTMSSDAPILMTHPYTIVTIHQVDKKEVLKHPEIILEIITNKLQSFLNNKTALVVMVCIVPLLLLLVLI